MVLEEDTEAYVPFTYEGPLAVDGVVKITIPLKAVTVLTGPSSVPAGEEFFLRAVTEDTLRPGVGLDGSFEVSLNGEPLASGTTDGDLPIPMTGLAPGGAHDHLHTRGQTPVGWLSHGGGVVGGDDHNHGHS